ncbi:F-box domain-containing protein [Mycena sanguinolenta]|uniref:F-box domain-containing protein n=1 Tax=Mycena sanguinolenta TaxID=230812 RepID=A0A8H7D6T6_9AGAR|nr:F-box domain-containing protein [Mycena sanguinolenta]
MPIDIVLEVLNFLHPLDLVHLAQTSRNFRGLLHEPAQEGIWRASFTAPLPMCPSNISGRRWAWLLFAPYFCEREAGSDNLGGGSYKHRVLVSEAHSVIDEYEALEQDQGPGPDDSGPLAAFVQKRLYLVQERHQILLQGVDWVRRVTKERANYEAECVNKIQASVEKRLVREGHDSRDMTPIRDTITHLVVVRKISRLSSKYWNEARPVFLAGILGAKRVRLSNELEARQSVLENILEAILSGRPPSTWTYTPGISDVIQFPEFQQLLDDTESEVLASDDPRLLTALEQLPAKLESWLAMERTSLAARVPHSMNASAEVLDLATTVFSCGETYAWDSYSNQPHCCLVGWKGAGACRGPTCHVSSVKFSERGSIAASALVRLAGLDPQDATADQMDALDPRFVCDDCPIQQRGQAVMTWRRCLQHSLDQSLEESDPPRHVSSWRLLSPLGAKDVRRREYNNKDWSRGDPIWLCSLCAAHFHGCRKYAEVVAHVLAQHDIARPKQDLHFIDRVGGHRPPRLPMFPFLRITWGGISLQPVRGGKTGQRQIDGLA